MSSDVIRSTCPSVDRNSPASAAADADTKNQSTTNSSPTQSIIELRGKQIHPLDPSLPRSPSHPFTPAALDQPPPPAAADGPLLRSAPVLRLVHQLDRPLLGPLLVALFNIVICLVLLCPTIGIVFVVCPLVMLLNNAVSVCLDKHRRITRLLSGPEDFWLHRMTLTQCVLVLEPSLDVGDLKELVRSRVIEARNEGGRKLFPKFTQKFVSIRTRRAWVDDVTFDLERHFRKAFPDDEPRSTAQVLEYTSQVRGRRLADDLPPWEVDVCGRMRDRSSATAVLFRCDPSLCDGITLLRILNRKLADRCASIERKKLFGPTDHVFNVVRAVCAGLLVIVKRVLSFEDFNLLHGPKMSGRRQVTWSEQMSLSKVTRISDVTRSHLNDVLLAVLSGTLRDYLIGRGVTNPFDVTSTLFVSMQKSRFCQRTTTSGDQTDKPEVTRPTTTDGPEMTSDGVGRGPDINGSRSCQSSEDLSRNAVDGKANAEMHWPTPPPPPPPPPTSSSTCSSSSASSNWKSDGVRMSLVNVTLPVNTEGAVPQLWEVRQRMNEVRSSVDHVIFYYCQTIFWHLLPRCLRERLWRVFFSQSTLLVSTLSGPEESLTIDDHRVTDLAYWAPDLADVALGVSFLSYAGQLRLCLSSDSAVVEDPEKLTEIFVFRMNVLSQLLANRRIPGERTLRLMRRRTSLLEPSATEIRNRIDDVERQLKNLESSSGGGYGEGEGEREVSGGVGGGLEGSGGSGVGGDRVASLRVEFEDMLQDLRRKLCQMHSDAANYESDDEVDDDDEEEDGVLRRPSRLHSFSGVSRGSILSVLSASTSCLVQTVSPTRSHDHVTTMIAVVTAPSSSGISGSSDAATPSFGGSHLAKKRHLSEQKLDPLSPRDSICRSQTTIDIPQDKSS